MSLKPYRVIVNGAHGRMGTLVCETLRAHTDFECVGELGRSDDLLRTIEVQQPDIVVDLTSAESVYANTLKIIESGTRAVVGTTGLAEKEVASLKALADARHIGVLICPNFSIAMLLMMRFASQAAAFFPQAEIIEMHHPAKRDAPSGTAIKTAEMMYAARKGNALQYHGSTDTTVPSKEVLAHVRGGVYKDVPIHSIRLSGVLAREDVILGSIGETMTISHQAMDRRCYMPGFIYACEKVMEVDALYYGLEHFL